MDEIENIKTRYEKRKSISSSRYNPLSSSVYLSEQEKERILIKWIKFSKIIPLNDKKLLEVGCGTGVNLLEFIKLGFKASNLTGNDLLYERVIEARAKLPLELKIIEGNALELNLKKNSFDIVFQSTMFSSILDFSFKKQLALKMWQLTKPGGGILWYDFIFNNPFNKDVKGIKLKEVKLLFPYGEIKKWKLTLAPPVARIVTKIYPPLYTAFNFFPFFRTHILCWIKKK